MSLSMPSKERGFSLAEVVISLAVLGLIASLTLPSLFMSMDRAKKRAVFKEAFQAISEAAHAATLEGGGNRMLIDKLNGAKVCLNNAFTEGCTTRHVDNEMGVKLASGVSLFSLDSDDWSPAWEWPDGVYIGLEDFPKKEYFIIAINFRNTPFNTASWPTWAFPSDMVRVDSIVKPGEVKCMEQVCLDMFKND
jgi:prepilin-type N-terminal cleavage/methylation domain-containing protein